MSFSLIPEILGAIRQDSNAVAASSYVAEQEVAAQFVLLGGLSGLNEETVLEVIVLRLFTCSVLGRRKCEA